MAEPHLRQDALAHLGLAARAVGEIGEAGIAMAVAPAMAQLALRGEAADAAFAGAVEAVLGLALPLTPNTTTAGEAGTAFWLGPDEWLLALDGPAADWIDRLETALAGRHHALNDVSESRLAIRLAGPRVRDLLAKATSLDLHPSIFPPGACAQSTAALTDMLLHRRAGEGGAVFDVHVHRSYADYLWRWLEAAAGEYGVVVLQAAMR